MSRGWSIRNCFCITSTSLRRTVFSAHTCRHGCTCRIRSVARWLTSASGLGRKALEKVAHVAKPDTILAWYRRLIAQKFDGSKRRSYPGRPRIDATIEALIVRMARENTGWGYDRIVGALANLGYHVSDQTVGNILRRHDIAPAPKRSPTTTWKEFIRRHMDGSPEPISSRAKC